jgi:hypothetical protein
VDKPMNADKAVLMAAFARIDPVALAVAMGAVGALGLFLMTVALLVKGAPPGAPVGPHLALLGIYLPGYSVSWTGSVIGALYAFLLGGVTGFVWAVMWNLTHYLYIILVVVRAHWWRLMGD